MRSQESNVGLDDAEGYSPESPDSSAAQLTDADVFDIKERIRREYADADPDDIEAENDRLEEACYELSVELERDGESAAPDRQYEYATLCAEKEALKQILEACRRE